MGCCDGGWWLGSQEALNNGRTKSDLRIKVCCFSFLSSTCHKLAAFNCHLAQVFVSEMGCLLISLRPIPVNLIATYWYQRPSFYLNLSQLESVVNNGLLLLG